MSFYQDKEGNIVQLVQQGHTDEKGVQLSRFTRHNGETAELPSHEFAAAYEACPQDVAEEERKRREAEGGHQEEHHTEE